MESTQQIRSKISEGIMRFVQSPFTPMDESENKRLQRLEEAMMATLRDGRSVFVRELLQTMACAWLYELWNIFFRRLQTSRTELNPHWGDAATQFFYLARCHAILLPGPHALPRATRSGVVRPAGGAFARRAVRRLEAFLRQDGRRHPDGTADGGGQSLTAQPVTVRAGGGRDAALCRPVGLRKVLQAAVRRVAHAIQKGDRAARIKFFCRLKPKKSRLLLVFHRKALLLPRNQNENTKHRELMKSFNYTYYFFFYFYFSHKVEREFVCVK